MGRVEGKVVVVTGAAGGQGAADAIALVREGATVIAADLQADAPALPSEVVYRRLDVSSADDWSVFGAWLAEQYGHVDGLVNNAGIPWRARLEEVALADWDRVLGVNLTGALLGIQAVVPLMRSRGLDREHQLGRWADRVPRRCVHRQQMGAPWPVAGCEPRAGIAWDSGEHDLSRIHRDAHDRVRTRELPHGEHHRDAARPDRDSRRYRAAGRLSDLG